MQILHKEISRPLRYNHMNVSLHKTAAEVARYGFIGKAYMLSELISDAIVDHYTSHDDRSMRVVALNALWHLLPDLLTSVQSFCPNAQEILVIPWNIIILENLQTPSNRGIILKLKEELQRSNENPEVDWFIYLVFSNLPIWKLIVIVLDLKKETNPRGHGPEELNCLRRFRSSHGTWKSASYRTENSASIRMEFNF